MRNVVVEPSQDKSMTRNMILSISIFSRVLLKEAKEDERRSLEVSHPVHSCSLTALHQS